MRLQFSIQLILNRLKQYVYGTALHQDQLLTRPLVHLHPQRVEYHTSLQITNITSHFSYVCIKM